MSRVLRRADHRRVPWRNGGGITYEVAASGGADFDWRVSIAEVETDGPFSTFDGVDRIITLIDGPWLDLTVDGTPHRLEPFVPYAFDGGSATTGVTPRRTRDLNVMTRRGVCRATLEVLQPTTAQQVPAGDPLLLVQLTGRTSAAGVELDAEDALLADPGEGLTVHGYGRVAVVRFTRT